MCRGRFSILSDAELRSVHEASLTILRNTGVLVQHPDVVQMLVSAGASVESARTIVHLPETLVMESIARAGKAYVLHGRDGRITARFGADELMLMSSPGQHAWFDAQTDQLRPATLDDAREAIRLGDALPNINIVGAMAQPAGMKDRFREVLLAAELIKGAAKPTRSWVSTVETARWVLELFRTVAGGAAALRARPMCADNELMAYVKRMARGLEISPDTLAADLVHTVQPGGNFLAEEHTVKHLRRELWLPGTTWNRQAFGPWESAGQPAMADRLRTEMQRLLKSPPSAPLTPGLAHALDEIVNRALDAFA